MKIYFNDTTEIKNQVIEWWCILGQVKTRNNEETIIADHEQFWRGELARWNGMDTPPWSCQEWNIVDFRQDIGKIVRQESKRSTWYNGHYELCKLILETTDSKNPSNGAGWTPLHDAAKNGHLKICRLIIDSVDDKNPGNVEGYTPLHDAATCGHLEVCQLIAKNVIDKRPMSTHGETPLRLAKVEGHTKVVEFLTQFEL